MTVEDIRVGFSGAEEFAEDKFVLPEFIVPHSDKVKPFRDKYGLDEDEVELMYDVRDNRVVFPVVNNGKIVDATGRALGRRLPKWKRYGKSGLPYAHGYGSVAVVVEDCVSAAVIGNDVWRGVALLGTSLSESHKRYLSQFSTAIIALDPDALPKTLAMAKELRSFTDEVRVLRLTDDLKYRNPTDLENLTNIGAM
jgi:DNA primase